MVRLTKAQRKERERILAWKNREPFKENARAKPEIPDLSIEEVLELYVPPEVSGSCQFFTPIEMAQALYDQIRHNLQDLALRVGEGEKLRVLEPCAGIGNLLYPLSHYYLDNVTVDAFDIEGECVEIGARLFPEFSWTHTVTFERAPALAGQYDLVLMNPPIGTKRGTAPGEAMCDGLCTKSEQLFLWLAITALKPGGLLALLAPYNFFDRLPKRFKKWVTERLEWTDLSELPGEFRFTSVKLHGWICERTDHASKLNLYGEARKDDLYAGNPVGLNEPVLPVKGKQLVFDLDPTEPPTPVFEGARAVADVIAYLRDETFREFPVEKSFVESVRKHGVYEPIICTQHEHADGYYWILRDGRRRLSAALEAKVAEIPVRLFIESDLLGDTMTLILNAQRSPNPVSEYKAIQRILDRAAAAGAPISLGDLQRATGMDVATLKKRLKLANLPEPILEALEAGKVARSTAERLANKPPSVQEAMIEVLQEEGKIRAKDLTEAAQVGASQAAAELPLEIFETPAQTIEVQLVLEIIQGEPAVVLASTDFELVKERYHKLINAKSRPTRAEYHLLVYNLEV